MAQNFEGFMKKYGLIVYENEIYKKRNWINLGDYVQSTAAKQFIPSCNSFISRDHMNSYSGDLVKMIMNAWYMDIPENFPPSKNINPLYVSMHLNTTILDRFFSKETIEHLKAHEPIGCRDLHTKEILEKKGIKAYYSGCMTLTLGHTYKRTNLTNNVYIIDPMYDSMTLSELMRKPLRFGKRILNGRAFEFNHRQKVLERHFDREILDSAQYIDQIIPYVDAKKGFELADDFLKKISSARLVITSRIHTALPCLAIGTPVIFINGGFKNILDNCRFNGLIDFFNRIDVDSKCKSMINYPSTNGKISFSNIPENKKMHEEFAASLSETCQKFMTR